MIHAVIYKRPGNRQYTPNRSLGILRKYLILSEHAHHQSWNDGHFWISTYTKDSRLNVTDDFVFFINGYLSSLPASGNDPIARELEYIERLYRSGGTSALASLRGAFVIGIYNRASRALEIVNDRYGIRPWFIGETEGRWLLGSRYHPFAFEDDFDKSLDGDALEEYFSIGMVIPPKTFFAKVRFLERGHLLKIAPGSLTESPAAYSERAEWPRSPSLGKSAEVFRLAVGRACETLIDRFGIKTMYLTGGSDSRLLLGCLTPERRAELGYLTFQDAKWSADNFDVAISRELAQRWQLKHEIQTFANGVVKPMPMGALATVFRRVHFPVLTASFGTELVGGGAFYALPLGYSFFRFDRYKKMRRKIFNGEALSRPCPYGKVIAGIESDLHASKEYGYLSQFFWRSFFTSTYSAHGTHVYVAPYENQHADKHSPFLSEDVLDVLMSLPREYLINYRLYDKLFSTSLKELAETPFNSTYTRYSTVAQDPRKPEEPRKNVKTPFPYLEVLRAVADDEAWAHPVFRREGLLREAETNFDLAVRAVDFLFWHELCVKGRMGAFDWSQSRLSPFVGERPFEKL